MSLMREERPSASLFAAFIYSRTYRTTPPFPLANPALGDYFEDFNRSTARLSPPGFSEWCRKRQSS